MNTQPTWSDSPIHELIRNMSTPTPRTNKAFLDGYTFCKEDMMPAVTFASQLETELITITEQRDEIEKNIRIELRGHPDSQLWGDAGLIAATMRCVDALDTVTEQRDAVTLRLGNTQERMINAERQRDRLAEALRMITTFDYSDLQCDNGHGARSVAVEALQSITPNEL